MANVNNWAFLTNAATNCTAILNVYQEIQRRAPGLHQYISSLASKGVEYLERYGRYAGNIVYYTTIAGATFHHAHAAEQQLQKAKYKADDERIVEAKVGRIFDFLEKLHGRSNEEVDIFLEIAKELEDKISEALGSLKTLRKDIELKLLDLASRNINVTALQLLSGIVGVGSAGAAVMALVPAIPFSLTVLPPSALTAVSIAGFIFFGINTSSKGKYSEAVGILTDVKSDALNLELKLNKAQTELEILCFEQRLYGVAYIERMLETLQD